MDKNDEMFLGRGMSTGVFYGVLSQRNHQIRSRIQAS
jgi:hypothetical protein